MLENSFLHLPGIGPETEERLWSQGLKTWNELTENLNQVFSDKKAAKVAKAIEESREAHELGQYDYFQGRFKGAEMWRLLPALIDKGLQNQIAFLDIETTGLGFPPESHSTTIAVLYNGELHLECDNERKYELLRKINEDAKILVTFNGGPFDLPFLRREFHLPFSQPHVDLRFWLARLEFRGGLKNIQKSFQEIPQRDFMDIDGYDAVRLWRLHEKGVPRALDTLFTYNAEDTIVLEQLIFCGLNLEARRRPQLNLKTYNHPVAPRIPYSVCPQVYRMLRS